MNLEQRRVLRWSLLLLGSIILFWQLTEWNWNRDTGAAWLVGLVLIAASQFVWAGRTRKPEGD